VENVSVDTEVEALRARLLQRDRELDDCREAMERLRFEQTLEVERIRLHSQEVQLASQQQLEELVAKRTNRLSLEITRRKEAERALRWSLNEIQDLYDHAPCGYHTLDVQGGYLRVNQTELNWLGVSREDLLGTCFAELVVPEDREFYRAQEVILATQGEVSDVQLSIATRGGRRMTIRLSATVAASPAGQRVTRAMFIDVTARHQAEEELRQHSAIMDAVLEGTTDAVFVKDLEGRYLMINSAGARFLGRQPADILGRDDSELFSPDTAQAIREKDLLVMQSDIAQLYPEYATSTGFRRLYSAMKGPYRDPQGKVIGLIGIARLIAETPVE